jgi:hypothetical protein
MTTTPSSNLPFLSWRGTDVAGKDLKPLAPTDFGQPAAAQQLKPLTFADYVVGSKNVQKSPHEQLVEQTQKWVSQTFYGTILKQMHDSPFKSEIFDGGRGGQAFSGLMDQHLADRMAKGANNKLVKNIVRRIEARAAYAKQRKEQQGGQGSTTEDLNTAKMRKDGSDVTPALRA